MIHLRNIFLFLIVCFVIPYKVLLSNKVSEISDKQEIFTPVLNELIKRGGDSAFFAELINNPNIKFNNRYVKINVTGKYKKHDYSHNYSAKSIKKAKIFLEDNSAVLNLAELEYSVPKEVITAILWVETRFGKILGKNNVPSVYFSTALATQKKYLERNRKELIRKVGAKSKELPVLKRKLQERSERKVNWALEELLALEEMHNSSPVQVETLKGSWAGAFGISQFLPSSYINWAVDGNKDSTINLFDFGDAIFSVANYLKTNGWGKTEEEQRKAVFHYNNSSAYVDAVLKLTEKLKTKGPEPDKETETAKK